MTPQSNGKSSGHCMSVTELAVSVGVNSPNKATASTKFNSATDQLAELISDFRILTLSNP